ncbi:hypothetical protein PSM36_1853 [Proteiniphilum saccharofermentans]|uniref:Uncharacterized protein n=1 Tax=Proteiniphilum saccharofermentans TaxID=1642647 RepID=A0A1R3T3Q9_9BACT|nr:hypothetical protein PSM36_1853 [Proteiniphilum saccharofermentans]SEA21173.1 hypothetical protein SAMN05216331_1266 [Porphyromonadaceae bacterium KH3R12]SFS50267.1 hypothetical protein SAMN05216365_10951 [Porphyromonadaceae bacterium NLAE-zl-C104]
MPGWRKKSVIYFFILNDCHIFAHRKLRIFKQQDQRGLSKVVIKKRYKLMTGSFCDRKK